MRSICEALKETHRAFEQDEVPVGSVVVTNQLIIARGSNTFFSVFSAYIS
jgi:tRNA(Arg) A34 adenosine deaminase TadA